MHGAGSKRARRRGHQGGTMHRVTGFVNQRLVPALTVLSENTYLSAIRAGMVSVVPLTIIGGLFMIVAFLPVAGWDKLVAPYRSCCRCR